MTTWSILRTRVNIASLREYCVNAVAQTAMKFLYAAAGELNHYSLNTVAFERKDSRGLHGAWRAPDPYRFRRRQDR